MHCRSSDRSFAASAAFECDEGHYEFSADATVNHSEANVQQLKQTWSLRSVEVRAFHTLNALKWKSPYTLCMALKFTTSYVEDSVALFRYYKQLADRAMAQVTDQQLFLALDHEANSIAIVVKHMAGNMRSRWTDFLTTDGEKPSRNRDSEFIAPAATREALLGDWESGWAALFGALQPLTDADLGRTITIRGEAHSVMQAINRQVAHYAHHVGQIVLLAKHYACDHWQSLSVPRNRSAEFNQKVAAGEASQR